MTIHTYVNASGYEIVVFDNDGGIAETYSAGNHPGDSQASLPVDHPLALDFETLEKFASITAREMAQEHGIEEEVTA